MKKIIKLAAFSVALSLCAFAFACQKGANTNSTNTSNSAGTTNSNAANTAVAPAAETQTSSVAGGPIDAYKAAYNARKNKDVAALKKVLAKDVLEFFTEIGKEDKKSLDDMLKELCDDPQAATAEARNEKINGDKASIEYLDEKGGWQRMDFVKEDGMWKLTIGKPDDEESAKPSTSNSNK